MKKYTDDLSVKWIGSPLRHRLTNRSGLTLIEIIIAMAFIGLLSIAFITLFSGTFSWVTRAGSRTVALQEAVSAAERREVPTSQSDVTVTVTFPAIPVVTHVGKDNEYAGAEREEQLSLHVFLPN